MFKTLAKDNKTNEMLVQGSVSKNTNQDIARIVFQNYDDDSKTTYSMASIALRDDKGSASADGYGDLAFSTASGSNNLRERVRILHDGKVGIGKSNPIFDVDVNGTVYADCLRISNNVILSDPDSGTLRLVTPTGANFALGPNFATQYGYIYSNNNEDTSNDAVAMKEKLCFTVEGMAAGTYKIGVTCSMRSEQYLGSYVHVISWVDDSNAPWSNIIENVPMMAHASDFANIQLGGGSHTFGVGFSSLNMRNVCLSRTALELHRLA